VSHQDLSVNLTCHVVLGLVKSDYVGAFKVSSVQSVYVGPILYHFCRRLNIFVELKVKPMRYKGSVWKAEVGGGTIEHYEELNR
jgi:hypothetical protein